MIDKEGRAGGKTLRRKDGKSFRFRNQYHPKTIGGAPPQYAQPFAADEYGKRWSGKWMIMPTVKQSRVEARKFTEHYFKSRGAAEFKRVVANAYARANKERAQRRKRT